MKRKDLTGKRYGRLLVIEATSKVGNNWQWKCLCDCGNETIVRGGNLTRGNTKSCHKCGWRENLTGQKFGTLTVLEYDKENKSKYTHWLCQCECGTIKSVRATNLKNGHVKTCGRGHGDTAFLHLFGSYKNGAKTRNLHFALSKKKFKELTQQNCHYCGSPPRQISMFRNYVYLYNGIDRVDNSVGYVAKNCVPCCEYCNRAKYNKTPEEFEIWVQRLVNFKAKSA